MEAVGIDDPLGDVGMLNETLGHLRGLNLLLHTRTLAGWVLGSVILPPSRVPVRTWYFSNLYFAQFAL